MQMISPNIFAAVVFGASVGLAPAWGQDAVTPSAEEATPLTNGVEQSETDPADGMTPGAQGTTSGADAAADDAISGDTGTDEAAPEVDGAMPDPEGGASGADAASDTDATSGTDAISGTDAADTDAPSEGAPDAVNPFAGSEIDIEGKGATVQEAQAFFDELDPMEQAEVLRRCEGAMINTATPNDATTLCANLEEAGVELGGSEDATDADAGTQSETGAEHRNRH